MSEFDEILEELQFLEEESVPKNVKQQILEIIELLKNESFEKSTKISKALSILDEIVNDNNLELHYRPSFWNISSMLESM